MTNIKNNFIPLVIILSAILFAGSLTMVSAQTTADSSVTTSAGVSFPVAELGNCTDKVSCRAYCDDPSHMDACISYGKSHGLINKEEADRGTRLATKLKGDSGPGGCKTPNECKAYCEDVNHLDVCLSFAKEHKLSDKNTADSERLASFIKAGGTMPGNCTSKETCEKYCSDFSHADECRTFAEKVGLNVSEGKKVVPPGQFQKFTEFVKKGKTPGSCTSKETCEKYCSDTANRAECITFGRESGIITSDKADRLEKNGVSGPGGCNSEESCRNYCNDQTHRDECFKFAGENNIISRDDLKKAEDGLVRFRQGLTNASPEVVACLKSSLGENIINDIQTGNLTPGTDIGERSKVCFEKFGKKLDVKEELNRVSPEVLTCVKGKLGNEFEAIQSGREEISVDHADVIRVCVERMRFMKDTATTTSDSVGIMRGETGTRSIKALPPVDISSFYNSLPQEVQACIKAKLGDRISSLSSENSTEEVRMVFSGCMESFKPSTQIMRDEPFPPKTIPSTTITPRYSDEIISCLKGSVNTDDIVRLTRGEKADVDPGILAKCISTVRASNTNTGIVPPSRQIQSILPPVRTEPFRPEVMVCLKQNLESDDFQKVLAGGKPEGASEIILKCINSVQSSTTNIRSVETSVPIRSTVDFVKPAI